MQDAKDSFYITLRDRLSTVNPGRTMTMRGVVRPGIFVEEAEAPMSELLTDVFVLRWTNLAADTQLPSILSSLICEIHYATAGTEANAGLDRGRALEEMDYELIAMLSPLSTPKVNYTQTPPAQMGTDVFWSPAVFAPETTVRERVGRVATVQIYAFEEQGEQ